MMPLSPEEELKALEKRIVRVSIIDAPGMIALGLGLFALFGNNPGGLHPLLENSTVATGLLIFGVAISTWSVTQIIAIVRRRSELQGKPNR